MNRFSYISSLFDRGADRYAGEVVSVSVRIVIDPSMSEGYHSPRQFFVSSKRKSWYRDAGVNAFHLHRDLCAGVRESGQYLTCRQYNALTKRLGDLVERSYCSAYVDRELQYFEYAVLVESSSESLATCVVDFHSTPWKLHIPLIKEFVRIHGDESKFIELYRNYVERLN